MVKDTLKCGYRLSRKKVLELSVYILIVQAVDVVVNLSWDAHQHSIPEAFCLHYFASVTIQHCNMDSVLGLVDLLTIGL